LSRAPPSNGSAMNLGLIDTAVGIGDRRVTSGRYGGGTRMLHPLRRFYGTRRGPMGSRKPLEAVLSDSPRGVNDKHIVACGSRVDCITRRRMCWQSCRRIAGATSNARLKADRWSAKNNVLIGSFSADIIDVAVHRPAWCRDDGARRRLPLQLDRRLLGQCRRIANALEDDRVFEPVG